MTRVIGIPSNGPELSDSISEHFGHCNYFVGIIIDEENNYEKTFSKANEGHSGCMEPVMDMKNRNVTDMIVGGIGGRPFIGCQQLGIALYQGVIGSSLEENIKFLLEGKLKSMSGASCGGSDTMHPH